MSEVGRAKTLVVDEPRTVRPEHHTPRGSLLWLAGEKPVRNRPRRRDARLAAGTGAHAASSTGRPSPRGHSLYETAVLRRAVSSTGVGVPQDGAIS